MTTVHILSPGFTTPNGAAFLFPLIVHRRAIAATAAPGPRPVW